MPPPPQRPEKPIATNRQARFRFELLERIDAGVVLVGSEVKSLRAGGVDLVDAHVRFERGEAWLVGMRNTPYQPNAAFAVDPVRTRKLLLRRVQMDRLARAVQAKGLTIVPTRLFFSGNHVKIEIALARGKNVADKRESIRRRDEDRSARRGLERS